MNTNTRLGRDTSRSRSPRRRSLTRSRSRDRRSRSDSRDRRDIILDAKNARKNWTDLKPGWTTRGDEVPTRFLRLHLFIHNTMALNPSYRK
ncbi:hypothetical protein V1477_003182 [Vespula maculifrons]|uniref:Uncharacterized protein n=1 Tax=Vespula maculifrons TaxID=7453 RepID=A0ABD2CTT2_VESMC